MCRVFHDKAIGGTRILRIKEADHGQLITELLSTKFHEDIRYHDDIASRDYFEATFPSPCRRYR
jgi:hypothetical protein